jgi:hypothetical protein
VIVISGALLVVAVVFLGIGLYGSLGWVYASIVVSVLAFGFMMVALRQQRDNGDEAAPPLHPVGLSHSPPSTASAIETGEVTLVPAAQVTSPDSDSDSDVETARPGDEATAVLPVEAPAADGPGDAAPEVPLVPATRKSAAKKTTAKSAAKTTAASKTTAAKEAAPAKKAAVRKTAAVRTDPTADPAPRRTRKAAVAKPEVSDEARPAEDSQAEGSHVETPEQSRPSDGDVPGD